MRCFHPPWLREAHGSCCKTLHCGCRAGDSSVSSDKATRSQSARSSAGPVTTPSMSLWEHPGSVEGVKLRLNFQSEPKNSYLVSLLGTVTWACRHRTPELGPQHKPGHDQPPREAVSALIFLPMDSPQREAISSSLSARMALFKMG